MSTQAEHMAWARQRALEYDDPFKAMASFTSDLTKHVSTLPFARAIGVLLIEALRDGDDVRAMIADLADMVTQTGRLG